MAGQNIFQDGRKPHWLKANHLNRTPHRWIVMDSEAHRNKTVFGESQTFRLAIARRWHDEGGTVRQEETDLFRDPWDLWSWVSEFTRKGRRTVLWCHNLDYDLQITKAFEILPALGWDLEWSNLDEQVSMATWRREGVTLAMTDTYTWCPRRLEDLGAMVRVPKPRLPDDDDSDAAWVERCMADVDITAAVVHEIIDYVRTADLGNMQLSGAGMGHSMWRHKYLTHKILVHDDARAIEAERTAMHAGRAEAWQHGTFSGSPLYEWDMRNAYTAIARDEDLPYKFIGYRHDPDPAWVEGWRSKWRMLFHVRIRTEIPTVPTVHEERRVWPVGEFDTILWDCEIDLARREGAEIVYLGVWCYLKAPIMQAWAQHTLTVLADEPAHIHPVILLWYKHQARATIGRCGMRYTNWVDAGPDWMGLTGFSMATDAADGRTFRLLHLGGKVWEEHGKTESRDSLPQVPSWIAARCRVLLWEAMRHVGLDDVLYVDTDSLLTSGEGHERMQAFARAHPAAGWRVKGIHRHAEIHGPRQILLSDRPRISGVPGKARRTGPATWEGEVWQRLGGALERGCVTEAKVLNRVWQLQWNDRRRTHVAHGRTEPVRLALSEAVL